MPNKLEFKMTPHPAHLDRTIVDFTAIEGRHTLGALCASGHDFRGSGRSMRYISPENCVVCALEYNAAWRAERRRQADASKPVVPAGHLFCGSCKEVHPEASFPRSKQERYRCKACWRDYKKAYYAAHPEVVAAQTLTALKRRRSDWMGQLLSGSRSSAKARGLDHAIALSDIVAAWERQGGRCYWLGIPLVPAAGRRHPLQPSLDRLDCARGYAPDNIVLASLLTNFGRTNTPADEFATIIEEVRRHLIAAV